MVALVLASSTASWLILPWWISHNLRSSDGRCLKGEQYTDNYEVLMKIIINLLAIVML